MSVSVMVLLPTPLRPYADGVESVEIEGSSVRDILEALVSRHPQLRRHLFDEAGQLRNFVNVYVNEDDVRYLRRESTLLKPGDTVSILPSIAGGAGSSVMQRVAPRRTDRLDMAEIRRYSRHLLLPEVGMAGQIRLKRASALVLGTGGLGSPVAMYLAAAGVGRIGLADYDIVDETNLQRQVLYSTRDVGRSKLQAAKDRIEGINPNIQVEVHDARLTSENALGILGGYDVIIDGTDNFPTRYLVNDACVLLGKPDVYGSIFRWEGQASVFWAAQGPCYRCLYPQPPPPGLVPSCAEGGVFGVLPGIVGSVQATEALKILLGRGDLLLGRLLTFDALTMKFRELRLRKNPGCPVCGANPTVTELIDYEAFCGLTPQGEVPLEAQYTIEPEPLKAKLDRGEVVLVDVREPNEWEINRIEGATLIPLARLPERVNELNTADEVVLYCKVGERSARAVNFLYELGFRKVKNLRGGIDAWIDRVDPSLARY